VRDLPAGTVTLLFADVEGSTRLLHALGERFAPARARMRELVRAAAADHGGAEVDWAGDGAFLAFSRARDAVVAATDIQRALAAEPWLPDEALRLRIGVHTGEPELDDEGYIGMDVVIAARICAAAHGEQIVVSRATHDKAGSEVVAGASYRPLGQHRLKDVPVTTQLFQVVVPELDDEFPPLKTLSATSLPALHHRLVGRSETLAQIETLLRSPHVRLVTITGPGGAGKSRLALEVAAAAALDRPVHLVGLAPITDPDLVPSAIGRAIGVRESDGQDLLESIAGKLDGTGALLFLDNLEHLAPAAVHIAALLDRASDLEVLVTSRAPLRLSGEHVLPLEPLPVDDAATLFVELAAARGVVLRDDALAAVHEICRRLDGLPLAIELVAARLVVLPPAEILRALSDGLALEMEGPIDLPERQRTLRAAIDWSYQRLSESQRELHSALAVFADGGALDDARAIAGAGREFLSDLEALVAWSLVRSEITGGDARLSMLETVREHALDRLHSEGRLDDLRRRHAERFLELSLTAESELAGPDQAIWFGRLELEFDNIRAALDWLLTSGEVEDALRMLSGLGRFWRANGHVTEARQWLTQGLAQSGDVPADVRGLALRSAAHMAMGQSDWEGSVPLLEEAVELLRESGRGADEVVALSYLSFVALRRNDPGRALDLGQEALEVARRLGDERTIASALMALGDVDWVHGDYERSQARYEEAVALSRRVNDPLLVVDAVYHFGMARYQASAPDRGRPQFEEALERARELNEEPHMAAAQFMLAELDVLAGDADGARERASEALKLYTELGDDRSCARCLVVLAGASAADGSPEEAARLVGAADALRGEEPDAFETAVLDRYASNLESLVGVHELARLRAEGASLGRDAFVREVVAAGTDE
jgi:predicted ATPase/class 3 adenylate cyclase